MMRPVLRASVCVRLNARQLLHMSIAPYLDLTEPRNPGPRAGAKYCVMPNMVDAVGVPLCTGLFCRKEGQLPYTKADGIAGPPIRSTHPGSNFERRGSKCSAPSYPASGDKRDAANRLFTTATCWDTGVRHPQGVLFLIWKPPPRKPQTCVPSLPVCMLTHAYDACPNRDTLEFGIRLVFCQMA